MGFNEDLEEFKNKVSSPEYITEETYTEKIFEDIKHINEYGQEFWYARELREVLGYTEYNKFLPTIQKAIKTCEQSGIAVSDHFAEVSEMVSIGSNAKRKMPSFQLSRYACYLIVMNGDPRKKIIALGVAAAKDAGVDTSMDYAKFQNYGYMGLYGGLKAKDIHEKKGLKKSQNILDHMGYEELAANLFRATQTEAKLKRENIKGKDNANQTHYDVGKEVRDTIKRLGGTMPEDLPTPDKSIKQIEKEQKKLK